MCVCVCVCVGECVYEYIMYDTMGRKRVIKVITIQTAEYTSKEFPTYI